MKRSIATAIFALAVGLCTPDLRAAESGYYDSGEVTVDLTQPKKLKFDFVMGSSDLVFQFGSNLMQRQQFDSLARRMAILDAVRIDSVVLTAYTSATDSRVGSRELADARLAGVKDYVIRTLEHNELGGVAIISYIAPAEGDGVDFIDQEAWGAEEMYDRLREVEFVVYMGVVGGYDERVAREEARVAVTSELTEMLADTISDAQKERQLAAILTNPYPVWNPNTYARTKQSTTAKVKDYSFKERYTGPIDQVLSLRTNLLYWLMFAPNGGLEFHIGGHFSILLEGAITYWNKRTDTGDKGIYVAGGGPQLRYWFSDDRSMAGHIIGIYGQYADFDIKLNEKGRQGTSIGGGISYGYYLPVGRRWAFEFGIGLGYLRNKVDVYKWNSIVQKNLWQEYKTKAWIGPTKVNATVILRIGHK
ncbi:MAG: DUF3575 domain-containing protein [Rikenella sp.]|nr:DUF3575 domain-containing protein [Rikenella sp.]